MEFAGTPTGQAGGLNMSLAAPAIESAKVGTAYCPVTAHGAEDLPLTGTGAFASLRPMHAALSLRGTSAGKGDAMIIIIAVALAIGLFTAPSSRSWATSPLGNHVTEYCGTYEAVGVKDPAKWLECRKEGSV